MGGRVAELVLKWSPPGMPPAQSEWPTGERTWYKKEWRDEAAVIHSDLIKKKKKPGTLFTKESESHHGTTDKLLDVWMFPCSITDSDLEPCPEKVRNVRLRIHASSARENPVQQVGSLQKTCYSRVVTENSKTNKNRETNVFYWPITKANVFRVRASHVFLFLFLAKH